MAYRFPAYVGGPGGKEIVESTERMSLGRAVWMLTPVLALVALVLGGIYAGWFTPTESGAVGALGALVLSLGKRRMTMAKLWEVLVETGHVTVSILFLIISANMYGRMLALSGITNFLGQWITTTGLGLYTFMTIYLFIIILMGTILDSSSILMIIVPLVYPVAKAMQLDFVWFGLVSVVAIEIGLITPPLGIAAYVVKGTLDDQRISLNDVFAGSFPFVVCMVIVLVLVVVFPQISLILVK